MTFCFTLYGEKDIKKYILTDYHPSDIKKRIIRWINLETEFSLEFKNYMQDFLRAKSEWTCNFVGIDAERQKQILSKFYSESIDGHENLLLNCNLCQLSNLWVSEKKTYWYWPFQGFFASDLEKLIQFIEKENFKNNLTTEEIKILFHF